MSVSKYKSGISVLALGMGLCACAQQSTTDEAALTEAASPTVETQTVKLGPAIATVKPGASVTFSHDVTPGLDVGDTGIAMITVNEGYPAGALTLTATGEPGLVVLGTDAATQINMAGQTSHTWRVDFATEAAGVFYLNVLAAAQPDAGPLESRAYAVRIEVGDWQSEQAKVQAAKPMAAQADGEMAVIMEAEETIE